ncbi:MAG: thioredoxin family protein [Micavibrio sp.]|nr:thioredoxin family protein [Micavibrio sp.]
MKKLLSLLAIAVLAIMPQAYAGDMEKEATSNTTVVAYHADWCGGCKILGPKMKEAMSKLSPEIKEKLAVVKFDFTDESTTEKSRALAEEKKLTAIFPKDKQATGQLKIIDNESGAVLAKINYKQSTEEIVGTLTSIAQRG